MSLPRLLVLGLVFLSFFQLSVAAPSCNDIELDPLDVTFSEKREQRSVTFFISNEGDDDFEIDDLRVQESSPHFDLSIDQFPDRVDEGEDERITLEYTTPDVNGDKTDTFTLQVRGEFDDDGLDCSFSDLTFTVHVTIVDATDACTLIEIEANDVSIPENERITHMIRVENNTSEDFSIQGFSVFDDSENFSTNLNPRFTDSAFEKIIPQNSSRDYAIDIDAQRVNQDETDSVFVEIRGEFADGVDCSFSEIEGEFDVTVEDTGVDTGFCASIFINTPPIFVRAGETSLHTATVYNKSTQTFFVDEYTIMDRNYQVSFEPLASPFDVPANENDELTFSAIGYPNTGSFDANAFLNLRGHFTDGGSCFINGKRIPYTFAGSPEGTCDAFNIGTQPVYVLRGTTMLELLFQNPLAHVATVTFTSDAGDVSPRTLRIPPQTTNIYTVRVPESEEEQTVSIQTEIPGCVIHPTQSIVLFSSVQDAPVQIKNAPTILSISPHARQFAIQLENRSGASQETTITLITKPGNSVFTKTLTINRLDDPLIFLPTSLLQGKTLAILQVKSAGYVVTHTFQLETTPAPTPTQPPVETQNPIQVVVGSITGFATTSRGLWAGLLVVLILIGLWYVAKPKIEQKTMIFAPKEVSPTQKLASEEEWPDEVWINPRK